MRMRMSGLAAAAALAAASLARAADPPAHPPPDEPAHTAAITPEEFLWEAAWLADDARCGRETTHGECREAADWIARRMERMGLLSPDGADRHLVAWTLPGSTPVPDGCALSVSREGGAARDFKYGADGEFVVLEGSAGGVAEGPAVFAGYGIRAPDMGYDDYAGVDGKGKVAVVFRHEPRENDPRSRWNGDQLTPHSWFLAKIRGAAQAGFAGLVIVPDSIHHREESLETGGAGRSEYPIPVALARGAFAEEVLRHAGTTSGDLQKRIDEADAPATTEPAGVRIRLQAKVRKESADNVAGVLPGSDPVLKREWVVVGAHYDHVGKGFGGGLEPRLYGQVHNGADDNASGTAAMLEVAESFALGGERPRRSLLFLAFSGEEEGLLGSRAFVEKPIIPLDRVAAMVNLDMVGRYRAGQFEVVGADSGSTLKETVDRVAAGSGLEYAHTNSGLSASDGFSFYQGKVPTVFLFTGLHDDYHRPSDDWWLLNAEGAAKVARLAAGMARALADADGRPAFREIDPSTMGMGRRARVILGVLFDEKNVGKGAVLQSVTQRSAAARAGLRGGDRVVSFGGREVAGPDDVRAALGLVRPGDTVAVRVVRGDETLDLRVSFPGQPGPVFGVAFAAEDDGKPGAPIQDVAPGSVAEAAGLKAGDRILSFAGKDVAGGSALPSILRATRAGDRVKVRVLRDGKETELEAAFPKDK